MQPLPDLSPQEIEAGLQRLQIAVDHAPFPFLILIEDDDQDASLFRYALRQTGGPVEFMRFEDGQRALDFFRGEGAFADRNQFPLPNLTVLDVRLVRGSGLEILEVIRNDPTLEELVVVGLTASEDRSELERARTLRIDDWISKPESLPDLVDIVRQLKELWLDVA